MIHLALFFIITSILWTKLNHYLSADVIIITICIKQTKAANRNIQIGGSQFRMRIVWPMSYM